MIKIDDLEYLCTNLANLSGIPVRLFKDDKQIYYYSMIKFIKDPFELDTVKAFDLKDNVTYLQNDYY